MYRIVRTGVLALAALALLLPACSGSNVDDGDEVPVGAAVSVETEVSANALELGASFDVTCILRDDAGQVIDGATYFEVTPTTVTTSRKTVTPEEAGEYTVTCSNEDGSLVDATPEMVVVEGGDEPPTGAPVRVRTRLPAPEMPGCQEGEVTCEVLDEEGNLLEGHPTTVTIAPAEGLALVGHRITTADEGTFTVTCALESGAEVTLEPAELVVTAARPVRIATSLEPATVLVGEPATVICTVTDACGDVTEDWATRVVADQGVTIEDHTVSAAAIGSYTVLCHTEEEVKPATEDTPAELVVAEPQLPPVRVELTADPDRTVYALNAVVTITATAYDEEGEVVPDAVIDLIVPAGMTTQGSNRYGFGSEGEFTFEAHLADDPTIADTLTLLCDAGNPPELLIFSPERGATFDGDGFIPVRGRVVDVGGGLSLTVNGVNIPLAADGSFDYAWDSNYGLNVLWFTAKDGLNKTTRTSRGYYYSSVWVPMDPPDVEAARLLDSVLFFLGQDFLDDGVHNPAEPDDIATIIEVLLTSVVDLRQLLGIGNGPIPLFHQEFPGLIDFGFDLVGIHFGVTGDLVIDVAIEEVILDGWRVNALYREGGIDFEIGIGSGDPADPGLGFILGATIALPVQLGFESPLDGTFLGIALDPPPSAHTITSAYARGAFINLSVDADMPPGGELTVAVRDASIRIEDIDINPLEDVIIDLGAIEIPVIGAIDLPEFSLAGLVGPVNDLIGDQLLENAITWVQDSLAGLVTPFISDAVAALVRQLVGVLGLELDIPLPQLPGAANAVTLHFATEPSSVHMDPIGGVFGLGASLTSAKAIDRNPLGSIVRGGCGGTDPETITFDGVAPLAAGFLFDFVNEAIFALWWGGGINLDLDLADLGGLGGMGNGVIHLQFLLPPIVTDCTAEGVMELQIGDLYLEVEGSALGFSLSLAGYADLRVPVELTTVNDKIALEIAGQPQLDLEVTESSGAVSMFVGMLPDLIEDQVLPMLVDGISSVLSAIPLPEIDLSALVPGVPAGTVIRLGGLTATTRHGYLILGVGLE